MSTLEKDVEQVLEGEKNAYELLIRLDERTKSIVTTLGAFQVGYVTKQEFKPVKDAVDNVPEAYVRKEDFSPVKNGFYAVAGFILLAVLGAITGLVVRSS
jgi:hypothetical protein